MGLRDTVTNLLRSLGSGRTHRLKRMLRTRSSDELPAPAKGNLLKGIEPQGPGRGLVVKRSSGRRARRWFIFVMTRRIDRRRSFVSAPSVGSR